MPDHSAPSPDPLLFTFEIDCGELTPHHRTVLTGLTDNGRSRSDLTSREQQTACPLVSLEFALVPGVRPDEVIDGFTEAFLPLAACHADVETPWTTAGFNGIGPSGIETFTGGASTHGTLGPWPAPDGTRRLTFVLHHPPTTAHDPHTPAAGTLVVDLSDQSAAWTPTGE